MIFNNYFYLRRIYIVVLEECDY